MADDPKVSSEVRIQELESLTYGFDELPLEHFRGMTAAEIESYGGIGPKFRQRILDGLAELDALRGYTPPPPRPEPAENLPAGGNPVLVGVTVLLVLMVLGLILYMTVGTDRVRALQMDLNQANQQVLMSADRFGQLARTLADDAQQQAEWVYRKVRNRNYGEALEHLENVDRSLRSLSSTVAGGNLSALAPGVQQAQSAQAAVQAALLLSQPQTQEQLEAACVRLREAIVPLQIDQAKE